MFSAILACALGVVAMGNSGKLQPFELKDVRLLGGYSKQQQDLNTKYLKSLDVDRLLYNFRINAGLTSSAKPYRGWEEPSCEVRGHFVGHYLSALALSYASTGDKELKKRADKIVQGFGECQKALGNGYLSAFPESFWDRLESLNQIPWAPYYTIHKLIAGLLDAYQYCGNKQALAIAEGEARYFKKRIDKVPDDRWSQILNVEYGGMNDGLYLLYEATKNKDYLDLGHRFDKREFLEPLSNKKDNLAGRHGNTHIPIVQGALRYAELSGYKPWKDAAYYFWDQVVNHHSYVTGGSTNGEVWGPADKLSGSFSTTNHEVCKTYNMLKLTRMLFCETGDMKYADYYERAMINGIWGTHQPETGYFEYYVPMITGAYRRYGVAEESFWCCYGSGVENWSKLGDSIYFHDAGSIWITQFVSSRVFWRKKGLTLTQKTSFPKSMFSKITIQAVKPVQADIVIRMPRWASKGSSIEVNGEPIARITPGAFTKVSRKWHDGDVIAVNMQMSLKTVSLPDDKDTVAVMFGPIVLAGDVTEPGQAKPVISSNSSYADVAANLEKWTLSGNPDRPTEWLETYGSKFAGYRTKKPNSVINFKPFYETVDNRYGLYWLVLKPGSERAKLHEEELAKEKALAARIIDEVTPLVNEAEHGLASENSNAGQFGGTNWRDAKDGWFSWDLKVLDDKQMTLLVRYWGSDVPPRSFDILVDGVKIATQELNRIKPNNLCDVEYLLPQELTRTKQKVTVKFVAHPGSIAGGVFRCAMLKP